MGTGLKLNCFQSKNLWNNERFLPITANEYSLCRKKNLQSNTRRFFLRCCCQFKCTGVHVCVYYTISKTSIVFSLNMESLYLIDSDCSSMQVRKAEPFSVFLIVTKSEYRLLFRYNAASVTMSEWSSWLWLRTRTVYEYLYHIGLVTSFFFQIVRSADFCIQSLWPPPKLLRGTLPFCLVGSRTQNWPQNGRSLPSRPWCSLRRAASTQWSK